MTRGGWVDGWLRRADDEHKAVGVSRTYYNQTWLPDKPAGRRVRLKKEGDAVRRKTC